MVRTSSFASNVMRSFQDDRDDMLLLGLCAFFFFPWVAPFSFSIDFLWTLLAKASLLPFDGDSVLVYLDGIVFGCACCCAALVTGGRKWDWVSNGNHVPHGCPWEVVGAEKVSQVGCDPRVEEDGWKGPNLIVGGRIKGCATVVMEVGLCRCLKAPEDEAKWACKDGCDAIDKR